jgi:hypothetical protein
MRPLVSFPKPQAKNELEKRIRGSGVPEGCDTQSPGLHGCLRILRNPLRDTLAYGLLIFAISSVAGMAEATRQTSAVPVRVDAAAGMTRGGVPYFVKGGGGGGSLEELSARGGNSIRTWTTGGLKEILDQAQLLDITVSAGIWLEQESSWFSYEKPEDCDAQAKRVREEIILYRDHPALLAWGIGNEVEGDGGSVAFWKQIDRLARIAKELDPAHPTFTALAGANPQKIEGLENYAPNLDFVGINTYGAVFRIRESLDELGWKRPWMVTEWGPRGFWESPKTSFGAPLEQTSSEKAKMIQDAYKTAISPHGGCLGSYIFLWGWKFEATATWFGVYTYTGELTAVADVLQEAWSGRKPANRAPRIEPLRGMPKAAVSPKTTFEVTVSATDPEQDPLVWEWEILPEHKDKHSNSRKTMPQAVATSILKASGDRVSIKAPGKPGVYRLYAKVKDGKGHAATANAPFLVR